MGRRKFLSDPLAALFPGGSLKAQMTAAGAAAGVAALSTGLVAKVDYLNTSQHVPARVKRLGLAVILGLGIGRLAWDHSRDAAIGIAGGMGAQLGAEGADWLLRQKFMGGTGYLGATDEVEQMMGHIAGGLSESTMIEAEERTQGRELDASVSVEDDSNLSSWVGGY